MKELTPEQYKVLKEKGTEAPFSGKYVHKTADGVYKCMACENPIFSSDAQFDSGTGWPSFDKAIPGAVKEIPDNGYGMNRTEIVCAKCNSHLGHVFNDGPTKTGMRYCINSVCLDLVLPSSLPKVIAFDLDGTLSQSKSPIDKEMVEVFCALLAHVPMSIVSGASKEQFEKQFLAYFPENFDFTSKLYIFPQNGAELIEYKNRNWNIVYENKLTDEDSKKIINALEQIIVDFKLDKSGLHGALIENRGNQITLSTLGQRAPVDLKYKWDPDQAIRKKMKAYLDPILQEYEIRIGGMTSLDITKKGINKAFAMYHLLKILNLPKESLLYFGDALYPGGNDAIVKENGFNTQTVNNPLETLSELRDILSKYEQISGK